MASKEQESRRHRQKELNLDLTPYVDVRMCGFRAFLGHLECRLLTSVQKPAGGLRGRNDIECAKHVKVCSTSQLSHASLDLQVLVGETGRVHQKTAQGPETGFFISDYMRQYWYYHCCEGHLQG